MRAGWLFLSVWATSLPMSSMNAARAEPPVICASDLGAAIDALPVDAATDPLDRLKARLSTLGDKSKEDSERTALRQVVSLIQILRTNRITPADQHVDVGVVAAVIRNNDRHGNH